MEKPLSETDLHVLRSTGKITNNEVAISVGDVVVAENVITKERRVLDLNGMNLILEVSKTLLRG